MNQFRLSHLIIALSVIGALGGGLWLVTADGAMEAGFHPSHPVLFASMVGMAFGAWRVRVERRTDSARR
ncbi:MAG: hypothetical protein ACRCY8_06010 [Dermatophilaceae bacterium]